MKNLMILMYLLFCLSGLILMKWGNTTSRWILFTIPTININITFISLIGYSCYVASFILYSIIISKNDISILVPFIGGIVNVMTVIAGIIIFGERITLNLLIGTLFIIVGSFIILK